MSVKIVTVQDNREIKMAKEIKRLREDWKEVLLKNKDCKEVDVKENRYHWYVKGIEDALGFVKICKLVELSREVI